MKEYYLFYQKLDKKLGNIPSLLLSLVLITLVATIAYMSFEIKEGKEFIAFILMWVGSLMGTAVVWFVGWGIYLFSQWVKYDFLTAFRETQEEFEYTPRKTGKVNFE